MYICCTSSAEQNLQIHNYGLSQNTKHFLQYLLSSIAASEILCGAEEHGCIRMLVKTTRMGLLASPDYQDMSA